MLFQTCLDNNTPLTGEFETCCQMGNYSCSGSITDANATLSTSLLGIKSAANEYLSCVRDEKARPDGNCGMADFCLRLAAGGTGAGAENDFDVGRNTSVNDNSLFVMARGAKTCSDMNPFGKRACSVLNNCCPTCQPLIANVVHHVTNDLLLPAYSTNVSDCPEMTCDQYNATRRFLEMTTPMSAAAMPIDSGINVEEMVDQCTNGLHADIVQFDEAHASEVFLECLYKKVGKIAFSITDETASSSSTTVGVVSVAGFIAASSMMVGMFV